MPLLQTRVRPQAPADGLCEDCHKNNHKYIRNDNFLCLYCWERREHLEYKDLTDEELENKRQESIKKLSSKKNRGIINTSNIGFND